MELPLAVETAHASINCRRSSILSGLHVQCRIRGDGEADVRVLEARMGASWFDEDRVGPRRVATRDRA
jgi:hypothetical protein